MVFSSKLVTKMCQNKTPPLIKVQNKTEKKLYDSEEESDVTFLVGQEPEVYRFPGHRKILSEKNPFFKAMFDGPWAKNDRNVLLPEVSSRGFEYLLRFIYNEEVEFQSCPSALLTLPVAHLYLCPELVQLCVKYLLENLTDDNVLQIFEQVWLYSSITQTADSYLLPSAPPECDLSTTHDESQVNNIYTCDRLVSACLDYIDDHACAVLKHENIEDADPVLLNDITSRSTLGVDSEFEVFAVLKRWSVRECKRRRMELDNENINLALGDLKYNVRYLVMEPKDFLEVVKSNILTQDEVTFIWSHLLNCNNDVSHQNVPESLRIRLNTMSCKRMAAKKNNPDITTKTTSSVTKSLVKRCASKDKKKNVVGDKKKPISRKNSTENSISEKKCSGSCFAENFLSVLSCIFD